MKKISKGISNNIRYSYGSEVSKNVIKLIMICIDVFLKCFIL